MNVNLLIDAIVRQTTVLIAQLATDAGARAPLAHTANQVFVSLVRELKEQGIGNKVIADMFGLSLRTYHNKIARLAESSTERGRSLWEAVLAHLRDSGPVSRAAVLTRFNNDDTATVRGVLKDLVDTGLVYRTGRAEAVTYRAAQPSEFPAGEEDNADRYANLVWVAVHRFGPVTRSELTELVPADAAELDQALRQLLADQRVECQEGDDEPTFSAAHCVIPVGDSAGWEAAVFDHYQAMVTAICTKLRRHGRSASPGEWVGGSTYHFDVWRGHPLFDEVVGFLQSTRDHAVNLRHRVEKHNESHCPEGSAPMRVVAYVGQTLLASDEDEENGP